jgi:hypothetical protein
MIIIILLLSLLIIDRVPMASGRVLPAFCASVTESDRCADVMQYADPMAARRLCCEVCSKAFILTAYGLTGFNSNKLVEILAKLALKLTDDIK